MRIASEGILTLNILFGCDRLDVDGFAWEFLNSEVTSSFVEACQQLFNQAENRFGVRDAAQKSSHLSGLIDRALLPLAHRYLHPQAFLVRSTLFDKPQDSNWAVPWHQDVTIEVAERHEIEGFGPWSVKEGVISVQPPASVLQKMLTLRLHLDPTDAENGALMVEPGSHLQGKLRINEIVTEEPVLCACQAGEILMMKPLLFHASNRSISDRPRRVLHLDFAYEGLPAPLEWRRAYSPSSR
ncbi:MAG: phytanoyl-CoA dioxygenase family protein [Armatimonadetes bacterium]|nr:phytanoyl-CoA dioxygenase family protein [Armatimonadota bacterium]